MLAIVRVKKVTYQIEVSTVNYVNGKLIIVSEDGITSEYSSKDVSITII